MNNFSYSIPFFIGFGLLTVAFLAPGTAVVQDVVHPGIRALAFGINVVIMNVLGAFFTPVIIGRLSDNIGLDKALFLLPVLGIFGSIFFFIARKYYLADIKNVEHITN